MKALKRARYDKALTFRKKGNEEQHKFNERLGTELENVTIVYKSNFRFYLVICIGVFIKTAKINPRQIQGLTKTLKLVHANNSVLKVPFPATPIKKDDIWLALVTPSPLDPLVAQILMACFKSLELFMDRMLQDHLQETKSSIPESFREETVSVSKTNTGSERDFAQLDRLLREKPHASTLALEAHILFLNNKTATWIESKSSEERSALMTTARRSAAQHRRKFRERLIQIEEERVKLQQKKETEKRVTERKVILEKEKITSDIVHIGLWQSVDQIDQKLASYASETQKREALKTQLRFRNKVLQQNYSDDKDIYKFSKNKAQFNSQTLRSNLAKLVEAATEDNLALVESSEASSLVGKRITHQFVENEELVAYAGMVISQVPGFVEWFNVVYDSEPDTVYTFKLQEDLRSGDLKLE